MFKVLQRQLKIHNKIYMHAEYVCKVTLADVL